MSDPERAFEGFALSKNEDWRLLEKIKFDARPLGPEDLDIQVEACGVCGSDYHCLAGHWGKRNDKLIAGHEIVGRIIRMGSECGSKFTLGQRVGTGALASSCRECTRCQERQYSYCSKLILTFNGTYPDGSFSQGGFASHVRANRNYVVAIPDAIPSAVAGPLMCAGITAYAPLLRNGIGKGKAVGIAGLGGVGHCGVILAKHLGAEVYVFSRSSTKRSDAKNMGADHFVLTSDRSLDYSVDLADAIDLLLICTNSFTELEMKKIIRVMKRGGKIVSVAEPPAAESLSLRPYGLLGVSFECSAVGTFEELEELLDLVSRDKIKFWIETMPINQENIARAFNKMEKGDSRYRISLIDYDKQFVNAGIGT